MLIEQTLFGTHDKVAEAIERIKAFEPRDGYYVAFSGGKDSVCVLALVKMAGVKCDAHYNVTSVDPPELVRFIKEKYPEVAIDVPRDDDGNPVTMWNLIPKKLMPPTRLVRYCCEALKEVGGYGRLTVTGVRWAESNNRKNNQGVVTIYDGGIDDRNFHQTDRGGVVLNNDNDESRQIVDTCYFKRKTVLNPIIDWEDEDVWEFIREYKIPYCKLYDEGFKRIGCIGCPMGGAKLQEREFDRWPQYKANYISAFDRMIEQRKAKSLSVVWQSGEDVMDWWLGKKKTKQLDGQIEFELGGTK